MNLQFGTTFRVTLKAVLLAAGWEPGDLDDELVHLAAGLRVEFLSGHAVRLRWPHGGGPVVSSRITEHEAAAFAVAEQIQQVVMQATNGGAQVALPADELGLARETTKE